MLRATVAARAVVDLAGIHLGGRDQIGGAAVWRIVRRHQPPFDGRDQRHRLEVLEDVPRQLRMKVRQHGHDAVVEAADGVPVGSCFRHTLRADQSGRARLIVDDDALAHVLGHALGDDAHGIVHGASGRQRHDHVNRLRRIDRLRRGERHPAHQRDCDRSSVQRKHLASFDVSQPAGVCDGDPCLVVAQCLQNSREAMRAPSAIAAIFAQTTSGSTAACPTQVP